MSNLSDFPTALDLAPVSSASSISLVYEVPAHPTPPPSPLFKPRDHNPQHHHRSSIPLDRNFISILCDSLVVVFQTSSVSTSSRRGHELLTTSHHPLTSTPSFHLEFSLFHFDQPLSYPATFTKPSNPQSETHSSALKSNIVYKPTTWLTAALMRVVSG